MQISGNNKELNKFVLYLQNKINKICINNLNKKLSTKLKNKKKYDVVTNLDIQIEKFLKQEIQKKYPNHNINGEELKYKKNRFNIY